MSKNVVAKEIKHLSSEDIENLYNRYLAGEKNAILLEEYNIEIYPNRLIGILPAIKLDDNLCPYCKVSMYKKRKSKSQHSWNIPPIECYGCDHKEFSKNGFYDKECNCDSCVLFREEEEVRAKKALQESIYEKYCIDRIEPIKYSELDFFHKITLLTLCRMQENEEFDFIKPLDNLLKTGLFTPTERMDIECLKKLFKAKIIIIDPQSRIEAFRMEDDLSPFSITMVRWIPNITFDGIKRADLDEVRDELGLELNNNDIQPQWENSIFEMLFKIATEEVLLYLYFMAAKFKINFTAEIKTRESVKLLLYDFSVSDITYIVKLSIKNASTFYESGGTTDKQYAANTIPNKIIIFGSKARNENWKLNNFKRNSKFPRSCVSEIFYDFFLQDGDSGFNKVPKKHWEQELYPRYFSDKNSVGNNNLVCKDCDSESVEVKMLENNIQINCKDCGCIREYNPKD